MPTVGDLIRELNGYDHDRQVLSATVKIKHADGNGTSTLIMRKPVKVKP